MKSQYWGIALFSAITAVFLSVSTAIAQTAEATRELNVRSGPGLGYSIQATFPQGARGTVINRDGDWVYIVAGRVEGWVYAPYIRIIDDGGDNNSGDMQRAEINGDDVNVRSDPNTNASIRATLPREVQVSIIDRSGDWAYVVAGRVEGWVFSRYLTILGEGFSGDNDGTGAGTITPGPVASRYESNGSILNARFRGTGLGEIEFVGSDRVVITANARGEGTRPAFSITYFGAVTSRSRSQITTDVTAFTSSAIDNQTEPLRGQCDIAVSIDSSFLESFTCQVTGSDHGRTIFNGQ